MRAGRIREVGKGALALVFPLVLCALCAICVRLAPTQTATQTPVPTPSATPAPTPPGVRLEAFEGVRSVRLAVEQSYPQIEEEFSLPIGETCRRILERLGFEVVHETGTTYDATLEVAVTGTALRGMYIPGGYLYTGAELEGSFSFVVAGQEPYERPFSAKKSPPKQLYSLSGTKKPSGPKKPRDAPFERLWQQPFFLALNDLWGVQPAIQSLRDEDSAVRSGALGALGEIGSEVVPALIEALRDGNAQVRELAALALGRIGPEARGAVSALTEALKDEDKGVIKAAARALGEIGPEPGVIPALAELLRDDDSGVRLSAADALGTIGPAAAPALTEALEDEDARVRTSAVGALGLVGPEPGVVFALIRALEDDSGQVREEATEALGKIGPEPGVVLALIGALKDVDEDVRSGAAEALEGIGAAAKEAIPALEEALKDESRFVRFAARQALDSIRRGTD